MNRLVGACEHCGDEVKRGQKYVSVTQRGRGADPRPDLFHARCTGAFRTGWGA